MPSLRATAAVEKDILAKRREFVFKLPNWVETQLLKVLVDSRDLPVARLLVNIVVTVVPAAFCVAYWPSHLLGALYCACNYVVFLQRFLVALLHVTEHRRLFRKGELALYCDSGILLVPEEKVQLLAACRYPRSKPDYSLRCGAAVWSS